MTITRANRMQEIATTITDMMHKAAPRTAEVFIEYIRPTEEDIANCSDWTREYHGILPGVEYFMVYETKAAAPDCPLYVVNVTADSYLTAASELMDLISRKF